MLVILTGPDGAVAMLLANGLVGTGFASQYRLQPIEAQWVDVRSLHPLVSHQPLTGLLLATNLLTS